VGRRARDEQAAEEPECLVEAEQRKQRHLPLMTDTDATRPQAPVSHPTSTRCGAAVPFLAMRSSAAANPAGSTRRTTCSPSRKKVACKLPSARRVRNSDVELGEV
jgi:hypothetical protein